MQTVCVHTRMNEREREREREREYINCCVIIIYYSTYITCTELLIYLLLRWSVVLSKFGISLWYQWHRRAREMCSQIQCEWRCEREAHVGERERERERGRELYLLTHLYAVIISSVFNFSEQKAFICNHDSHWLTVRKLGLQVYIHVIQSRIQWNLSIKDLKIKDPCLLSQLHREVY